MSAEGIRQAIEGAITYLSEHSDQAYSNSQARTTIHAGRQAAVRRARQRAIPLAVEVTSR